MAEPSTVMDRLYHHARIAGFTGIASMVLGNALLIYALAFYIGIGSHLPFVIHAAASTIFVLTMTLALASWRHRDRVRCPKCREALWGLFFREKRLLAAPAAYTKCPACHFDLLDPLSQGGLREN